MNTKKTDHSLKNLPKFNSPKCLHHQFASARTNRNPPVFFQPQKTAVAWCWCLGWPWATTFRSVVITPAVGETHVATCQIPGLSKVVFTNGGGSDKNIGTSSKNRGKQAKHPQNGVGFIFHGIFPIKFLDDLGVGKLPDFSETSIFWAGCQPNKTWKIPPLPFAGSDRDRLIDGSDRPLPLLSLVKIMAPKSIHRHIGSGDHSPSIPCYVWCFMCFFHGKRRWISSISKETWEGLKDYSFSCLLKVSIFLGGHVEGGPILRRALFVLQSRFFWKKVWGVLQSNQTLKYHCSLKV